MTWIVFDENREVKGVLASLDDLFDDYGLALPVTDTTIQFTYSDRVVVSFEHLFAGPQTYTLEKH